VKPQPCKDHGCRICPTCRYYARLDRANRKALDKDDPESPPPPPPPIGQRIADGFALIALAGDDDGEDSR